MKTFFVFLFLLQWSLSSAWGGAGLEGMISRGQQRQLDTLQHLGESEKERKYGGHSVAPVVGYEPVFRFCYGGAYFYQNPEISLGLDVNTNFNQVYQAHSQMSLRFLEGWEVGYKAHITKGFDSYFGEGGETSPESFTRLWGVRSVNRLYVAYKPTSILAVGPFVDYRVHLEDLNNPPTPFQRTAPDEQTASLGVFLKLDTVSDREEVTDGFVFTALLTHVPSYLSSIPNKSPFTQVEGEFIVYKEILEGYVPGVVAAFHMLGGTTLGVPSYSYKYRLGGSGTMRGYLENRFRGAKYYAQQTELRFPIWKLFTGAGFIGFGDATDGTFTNAKVAYGFGLRIGLPPDFVSKVRIDVGFGRDSEGIYADFGQAF